MENDSRYWSPWRAFGSALLTSVYLALAESILFGCGILALDLFSNIIHFIPIAVTRPLGAILLDCLGLFVIRLIFGYIPANALIFWALDRLNRRIKLRAIATINATVIVMIYIAWNFLLGGDYEFLTDTKIGVNVVFCALLSPWILVELQLPANIISRIVRK